MKQTSALAILVSLALVFSGAIDYRGLDELTVVAGMAIDSDGESGYILSMEIVNSSGQEGKEGTPSYLVEGKGETIPVAINNINRQMKSELYFGNTGVVVISQSIAKEEGLSNIIDVIMRNFYFRDDINIVVSKMKNAKDLFFAKDESQPVISFAITDALKRPHYHTDAVYPTPLYKIYNTLAKNSYEITLPAYLVKEEPDKESGEKTKRLYAEDIAVFDKEKMVGYFEEEFVESFLIVKEEIKGGAYRFCFGEQADSRESRHDVTINIEDSKATLKYEFDGEKFTFIVDVEMQSYVLELPVDISTLNNETMKELESAAGKSMSDDIEKCINKMQQGDGLDIFGFSQAVFRKDFKLYQELRDDWKKYFKNAEIRVNCSMEIDDAGMTYTYKINSNDQNTA